MSKAQARRGFKLAQHKIRVSDRIARFEALLETREAQSVVLRQKLIEEWPDVVEMADKTAISMMERTLKALLETGEPDAQKKASEMGDRFRDMFLSSAEQSQKHLRQVAANLIYFVKGRLSGNRELLERLERKAVAS